MYLLIKDGSDSVVELGAKKRVHWMLGRDPSCDLVLDDPGVSRFHATLFYVEEQLYVIDHSVNGTHVPYCQEELDVIMSRALALDTPAAPRSEDTQEIEPFERVLDVPDMDGPEDLNKSVTELRISESLTRVPRIPGYEARRPISPETVAPILQMIHSDTDCQYLAGTGRRLHAGASIIIVGRQRHLYSIHGDDA